MVEMRLKDPTSGKTHTMKLPEHPYEHPPYEYREYPKHVPGVNGKPVEVRSEDEEMAVLQQHQDKEDAETEAKEAAPKRRGRPARQVTEPEEDEVTSDEAERESE